MVVGIGRKVCLCGDSGKKLVVGRGKGHRLDASGFEVFKELSVGCLL